MGDGTRAGTLRQVDRPDGPMRVYEVDGSAPDSPAIVLFPDVLGLHDEVLDFCDRIGRHGYRCLAPDVYYRDHFAAFRGMADIDLMLAAGKRLRSVDLAEDIRALVSYTRETGSPERMGTIGFCRGGSQAIIAAGTVPDTIVSAIGAYPTRLLQDSPDTGYVRWLPSIQAELRILTPGHDDLLPRVELDRLVTEMDKLGLDYQVRIHVDAVHGWNFVSRPEYDARADADTWAVAFEAWHRLLASQPASSSRQQRTATPRVVEIPGRASNVLGSAS